LVACTLGAGPLEPARFADGFRTAMTIAAVLCAAGGVLSWLTIRNPEPEPTAPDHPMSCPLNAPSPVARRS
jgi:hypothetical protein